MVHNLCMEFKNKFCHEDQPEKQEKEICRMLMQGYVNAKFFMPAKKDGNEITQSRK